MLLLVVRGLPGLYNGHRGTVTNSTGGGGVVEYQLPLQHLLNLTAALMFKFKDAQADRQQTAFVNQGSICFSPVSFVLLLFMKY